MEDVHFYLKSQPGKDGKCLIVLIMNYYGDNRLIITFNQHIHPSHWDDKRELPRKTYSNYHFLKTVLDDWKTTTEDTYSDYIARKILPSVPELRESIKAKMRPKSSKEEYSLQDFIKSFIEERIKARYAEGTIETYRSLLKQLNGYRNSISFKEINVRWILGFKNHLNDQGLAQNYVSKVISNLKLVLGEAYEDKLHTNTEYLSKRIKAPRVETTQIYLNEEEIDRIYAYPCTGEREEARDLYVLMCYTGPRISDVFKFGRSTFFQENGIEYFSFHMQKTKHAVHIPVHPYVKAILEKYNWKLKERSRQRLTDHIKAVAKEAKIDQIIDVVTYPGSVMKITQLPKYSQIKPHTARRSLACNMLLAGVPEHIVMSVGGWKSSKSFQPYVRLTANDKLKVASRSHFFTGARVIGLGG